MSGSYKMSDYFYTNSTEPDLVNLNYQVHDDIQKIANRNIKRKMFEAYKRGLEDENHWCHKWDDLPFIGRYRRIKRFLIWYNEYMEKDK